MLSAYQTILVWDQAFDSQERQEESSLLNQPSIYLGILFNKLSQHDLMLSNLTFKLDLD